MLLTGTKWMFKSYIDRTIRPSRPSENISYTIKNSNYNQSRKIVEVENKAGTSSGYGYQSSTSYSGERYVMRFRADGKYDLWGEYGTMSTFSFPEDIITISFSNIDPNKEVCKNGFDEWLYQNAIKVMDLTNPNSLKGTLWKIFNPIKEGWLGIEGVYSDTQFVVLEGYEDYGYPSSTGKVIQFGYEYQTGSSVPSYFCYMWNRNGVRITIDTKTLKNKTIEFKDITGYNFKFGGVLEEDETFRDSLLDSAYRIYRISSISIESTGISGNYFVNDTLDLSNIVIKKIYEDGFEETITSGFTVSTPDMSTSGIKNIIISYTEDGKTVNTSFQITVRSRISYKNGDVLINCDVYYHDGTEFKQIEPSVKIGNTFVSDNIYFDPDTEEFKVEE